MVAQAEALLLDTHAAIWFVAGLLDSITAEAIIAAGVSARVYVSPVSAWEIGLLARPKISGEPRLTFEPSAQSWFDALLAKPIIREAPFTARIAISSSFLPGSFHDDPADRMLVATARDMNVPIVTRDRRILAYGVAGHVRTLAC